MKKPVYKYCNTVYAISAILTIPLLIDICTACHLFSLWLAWLLFAIILIISLVRLWFAFSQKCYKFAFGLIGQLVLGAGVLTFFQLSYTNVIETPVSHPVTPALVNIALPVVHNDSIDILDHKDSKDLKDREKDSKDKNKKDESSESHKNDNNKINAETEKKEKNN